MRRRALLSLLATLGIGGVQLVSGCRCAQPAEYATEVTSQADNFVIYGDSRARFALEFWRDKPDEERRAVIKAVAAESPAFIIHSGDMITMGSSCGDWETFDQEHAAYVTQKIPFWVAIGNHEYWGDDDDARANWMARLPLARNKDKLYYERRWRSLAFLILDSNRDELTDDQAEAQLTWLAERLKALDSDPAVKAVVVSTHHPAFTNSKVHSPDAWVQGPVRDVLKTSQKYRAMFSGHVHSYERFLIDGVHYLVAGGGGAPLTDVGANRTPDAYKGKHRRFHYIRGRLTRTAVVFETMMLTKSKKWRRVDRFRIPL